MGRLQDKVAFIFRWASPKTLLVSRFFWRQTRRG
jgi:hypothetical protein